MREIQCHSWTVALGQPFRCHLKVLHDGDHEYEFTSLQKLVWHKFHRQGRSKP